MSQVRTELNKWLGQIEVKGRVLDVGGIACPMRNMVKDVGITEYKILDRRSERKGVKTDYIGDLNSYEKLIQNSKEREFDVIFCTEVMQFVWNPYNALLNIFHELTPCGLLYITFHLTHPPMKDADYLRYTEKGIRKLMSETGFEIEYIKEPINGYYLVKSICQH